MTARIPSIGLAVALSMSASLACAEYEDRLNIGPFEPVEAAEVPAAEAEKPAGTEMAEVDAPAEAAPRRSRRERPAGEAGGRGAADGERAAALRPLVMKYAEEHGLPFALADAVVRIESRYNAGARNGPHMGLTQINHRTARSLGYAGAPAGLLDPDTNLRYGLRYLGDAYRLARGDTCGAILRYQAGHRAVSMTGAARKYCARVKTMTAAAD